MLIQIYQLVICERFASERSNVCRNLFECLNPFILIKQSLYEYSLSLFVLSGCHINLNFPFTYGVIVTPLFNDARQPKLNSNHFRLLKTPPEKINICGSLQLTRAHLSWIATGLLHPQQTMPRLIILKRRDFFIRYLLLSCGQPIVVATHNDLAKWI